ncbi:hypothetical protein SPHINGOAX6_70136 [Sphingomonas sp. AX6]|nr:hypothetical protein SPHINGOAX6_70136 [Sphingomonas sp. AX6]
MPVIARRFLSWAGLGRNRVAAKSMRVARPADTLRICASIDAVLAAPEWRTRTSTSRRELAFAADGLEKASRTSTSISDAPPAKMIIGINVTPFLPSYIIRSR